MQVRTNRCKTLFGAALLTPFLGQLLAAPAWAAEGAAEAGTQAEATTAERGDKAPNWQERTLTGDWGGAPKRV